jgi:hypothetical protein
MCLKRGGIGASLLSGIAPPLAMDAARAFSSRSVARIGEGVAMTEVARKRRGRAEKRMIGEGCRLYVAVVVLGSV